MGQQESKYFVVGYKRGERIEALVSAPWFYEFDAVEEVLKMPPGGTLALTSPLASLTIIRTDRHLKAHWWADDA